VQLVGLSAGNGRLRSSAANALLNPDDEASGRGVTPLIKDQAVQLKELAVQSVYKKVLF
jgi:hypothetical protein